VEESKRRGEENRRNRERWLEATPECLRPFWEQRDHDRDPKVQALLLDALRKAFPTAEAQVLILLGWFGSGVGPWSGYPSYESVPQQLLLHYPTPLLIQTLTSTTPTESQWLGAARYFESWDFGRTRKEDRKLLTTALRQRLLEAARRTGIPDNVQRAEHDYGC
jgi:hypothetical protein